MRSGGRGAAAGRRRGGSASRALTRAWARAKGRAWACRRCSVHFASRPRATSRAPRRGREGTDAGSKRSLREPVHELPHAGLDARSRLFGRTVEQELAAVHHADAIGGPPRQNLQRSRGPNGGGPRADPADFIAELSDSQLEEILPDGTLGRWHRRRRVGRQRRPRSNALEVVEGGRPRRARPPTRRQMNESLRNGLNAPVRSETSHQLFFVRRWESPRVTRHNRRSENVRRHPGRSR